MCWINSDKLQRCHCSPKLVKGVAGAQVMWSLAHVFSKGSSGMDECPEGASQAYLFPILGKMAYGRAALTLGRRHWKVMMEDVLDIRQAVRDGGGPVTRFLAVAASLLHCLKTACSCARRGDAGVQPPGSRCEPCLHPLQTISYSAAVHLGMFYHSFSTLALFGSKRLG